MLLDVSLCSTSAHTSKSQINGGRDPDSLKSGISTTGTGAIQDCFKRIFGGRINDAGAVLLCEFQTIGRNIHCDHVRATGVLQQLDNGQPDHSGTNNYRRSIRFFNTMYRVQCDGVRLNKRRILEWEALRYTIQNPLRNFYKLGKGAILTILLTGDA